MRHPCALHRLAGAHARQQSVAAAAAAAATPAIAATRALATAAAAAPRLFTPGPLTTSATVKAAMQTDVGSRDERFLQVVAEIRDSLLSIGGTSRARGYEAVLIQGSGTFGVEAVLGSLLPKGGGKLLVASNGAYGKRMVAMARVLGIPVVEVEQHEARMVDVARVVREVEKDSAITHVAAVHHETTAGVLNDMAGLGKALAALSPSRPAPVSLIVDSMSAFGAYPVDVHAWGGPGTVAAVVSSANKCIEGVPGFSFALVSKEALGKAKGNGRSLSMDLHAQWAGLEANGQFRFTPPTHALLAFRQALREHEAEGGWKGRLARYQDNCKVLLEGMAQLGFQPYVTGPAQGCIITTFLVPDHPSFSFNKAYEGLAARGCLIYPGKTTAADSFRIGSIGQLYPRDMREVVQALREVLQEQGVPVPVKQHKA